MHKIKENLAMTRKGYQLMIQLSPQLFWSSLTQGFFEAVFPFIPFFFTSKILNLLLQGENEATLIYWVIGALVTGYCSSIISNGISHYRIGLIYSAMDRKEMLLNTKIIHMDYELVEKSETHDLKNTIKQSEYAGGIGLFLLLNETKNYFQQIFSLIISFIFLWSLFTSTSQTMTIAFDADSPWILIGFSIALLLFSILSLKINERTQDKIMKLLLKGGVWVNNAAQFFLSQLMNYNSGKEIRLYKQQPIYQTNMRRLYTYTRDTMAEVTRSRYRTTIIVQLMSYLLLASGYFWLIVKAMNGAVLPGSVVQYAGAFTLFIREFPNLLSSIQDLINNVEGLKMLFEFLELKTDRHEGTLPVEKRLDNEYTLEVRDVSFAYPGTDEMVLQNISLKFEVGEKMAIVGMNGSGKTTLIKLICRLYDPTEGVILLNGIDIKKYDYQEYLRLLSVVFQDFHLYAFKLGNNVAASNGMDEEKTIAALEKVGFSNRLATLSEKLDTFLYKNYDESGIEFSGGEAQKIAMARAVYKNAPIVILDEPTAALDPLSESEIYENFAEVIGNRTAIYISHRLSSCRFCDRIAVFDEGKLVQLGSHDELVENKKGKYYELWNAQAQYYHKNKEDEIEEVSLAAV